MTSDAVRALWHKYTYSTSELLDYVAVYWQGKTHTIGNFSTGTINNLRIGDAWLNVTELSTVSYGRCAVVHFDMRIKEVANIWIDVRAKLGPVLIFVTEPGPNRIGVSADYWTRGYEMLKVESGSAAVASVAKKIDYLGILDPFVHKNSLLLHYLQTRVSSHVLIV